MNRVQSEEQRVSPQRVGEVVEASSERFTAQCYQLYQSPPLGAFVRTGGTLTPAFGHPSPSGRGAGGEGEYADIFAVVYNVATESLDPGRPVAARGEGEDSEDDIYRGNPQLSRLLCTRFEALIVGHGDGKSFNQYLPALPPRIHAFVYACTPEEVGRFVGSLDFVSLLLHSSSVGRGMADDVVSACLRGASAYLDEPHTFLVEAGKALAIQLSGDPPRLNSILRRLSP